MIKRIFFWIAVFSFAGLQAQLTPDEMVKRMGRGINIGNVLSAPVEGNWSPAVTRQYFKDVAEAGFTTVRIPMDFYGNRTSGDTSGYSRDAGTSDEYTGSISDFSVQAAYLNRIEQVVGWALDEGLVTIIDLHGSDLKTEFLYTFDRKNKHPQQRTDPTSAKRLADLDKFKAIWLDIAERFKDKPQDLLFEIVNEPYFEIGIDDMNALNSMIINAIRNTGGNNSTRFIVITGGQLNAEEAPTTIDPAILDGDDYLIATFHYYKPNEFTKSTRDDKDQNTWGTSAEKLAIRQAFDLVKNWSVIHQTSILLGEFGADNERGYDYSTGDLKVINSNATGYADGGPDRSSRLEYYRYLAEQAINRGFAFTVWDAGPKSNKTINKRTDSPETFNYDIDHFSVVSYNPKNTVKSTVRDTSKWVEDIKNALLTAGEWPLAVGDFTLSDEQVRFYPNPAKDALMIAAGFKPEKLTIYTVYGVKVLETKVLSGSIDLKNLREGVYIVKAVFKNRGFYSGKLIITR